MRCSWDVNSGVMVLEPSESEWQRMLRLVHNKSFVRVGDGGDQSLWRTFYPRVHELPATYNAVKSDNLSWPSEAHVLHDLWGTRWSKWWLPSAGEQVVRVYTELTVTANRLMGTARLRGGNDSRLVCYNKNLFHLCDEDPGRARPGVAAG